MNLKTEYADSYKDIGTAKGKSSRLRFLYYGRRDRIGDFVSHGNFTQRLTPCIYIQYSYLDYVPLVHSFHSFPSCVYLPAGQNSFSRENATV